MTSMLRLRRLWFSLFLFSFVLGAQGASEDLELVSAMDFFTPSDGPLIIDGQPANPAEYPLSFMLRIDGGKQYCTWFLVGARALLTAAHCVSKNSTVQIKTVLNGVHIYVKGSCEQADGSEDDPSRDWAICLLDKDYPVPIVAGQPVSGYEVIERDIAEIKISTTIEITGYGCTNEDGDIDKVYRTGTAKVVQLPPLAKPPGWFISAPNLIKLEKKPSQLCSGDSGGPAFVVDSTSRLLRRVIGINSQTVYALGSGYLASTSTNDAISFFQTWTTKHNQEICGISSNAKNCRPTKP